MELTSHNNMFGRTRFKIMDIETEKENPKYVSMI
jgi:hypothetical protein